MHDNSLPVGDRDDYDDDEKVLRYNEYSYVTGKKWKEAQAIKEDKEDWEIAQAELEKEIKQAFDDLKKTAIYNVVSIPSPFAVWAVADNNGWHDPSCSLETDLLLIHSEVSEACEAMRIGNINEKDGVGEELADIVIRVFHTAQKNNIDIVDEIFKKHNKNMSRGFRHGGKKF